MKAHYYTKTGAMYECELVQCSSCRIVGVQQGTEQCLEYHVASDRAFDKKPQLIFAYAAVVGRRTESNYCRHCMDKMGLNDDLEEC